MLDLASYIIQRRICLNQSNLCKLMIFINKNMDRSAKDLVRWTLSPLDWYVYISFLHNFLSHTNSNQFQHGDASYSYTSTQKLSYFNTSMSVSLTSAKKKINPTDTARILLFSERQNCASHRNVMTSFGKTKRHRVFLATAVNVTK